MNEKKPKTTKLPKEVEDFLAAYAAWYERNSGTVSADSNPSDPPPPPPGPIKP